ncbi:FtsX-like permease family protein [Aureliella helgolandensis]|uniref:FtsX-like permease family protein n=1 Tax=Aureliella helgolandensis TaxID=2527968 RepID=A0A518GCL0_9BACT|nr:ABC transporter permease [Aureliella helgolandensis]QDV26334.1 FtsX-like permease family protein [Aureliella helgolandensis]
MITPTRWTLVARSLSYFRRSHVTVALGIAAATAVIVGALLVGDSVRGSLKGLVVHRLANLEGVLHARSFFEPDVLAPLRDSVAVIPPGITAEQQLEPRTLVEAISLPGASVEYRNDKQLFRASQVQLLAPADEFWRALKPAPGQASSTVVDAGDATGGNQAFRLAPDTVAMNQSLAEELSLEVGDEVTLRMSRTPGVPADNPLGRRDDRSISLPRQTVVAILPDDGIGGLRFTAGQVAPRNVFCALESVQETLECGQRVNAALVLNASPVDRVDPSSDRWCKTASERLHPQLEDYGLQLERHTQRFGEDADGNGAEQTVFDYFQLSSTEMILDNATATAVTDQLAIYPGKRLLTYLANTITKVEPDEEDWSKPRVIEPFFRGPRGGASVLGERGQGLEDQGDLDFDPDIEPGELTDRESADLALQAVREANGAAGSDAEANESEASDLAKESVPLAQAADAPGNIGERVVPYSIIVGIEQNSNLRLRNFTTVPLRDLRLPHCWINTWLAEELGAQAGDWIEITYFAPETVEGREVERRSRLMVAGVVPLTEPSAPYRRGAAAKFSAAPTIFNDPAMTPTVPGVTDQDSISNWDLPFALKDELILDQDDEYWNNHRLTPKIYADYAYLASGQMFGSRFGNTTSIRIPADRVQSEQELRAGIETALLRTRREMGFVFQAIRNQQLQSASGTTPFDMLFLSLSFFVILAALLLVSLLMKLGLDKRVEQLGVLFAQGYSPPQVRRLLIQEHFLVACLGAALGVPLGIGYARGMIAGLQTWWLGAISTPFLQFQMSGASLVIGWAAGLAASWLAMYWGLRRMSRQAPLALLRGVEQQTGVSGVRERRARLAIAGFTLFAACGLAVAGLGQVGMARAGIFFGSGFLVLVAILLGMRHWMEVGYKATTLAPRYGLLTLAWRAISRNPMRSSLSLGLLAVASFLIASMGAFQVAPDEKGYGGFNLLAESSQPIYRNMMSAKAREEMIGPAAEALLDTTIFSMRVRPGEDASCNNLYQVSQPTILAVSSRLQELQDFSPNAAVFSWAANVEPEAPWRSLQVFGNGDRSNPIPVVLDQNTAAWSLKQGASLGALLELEFDGRTLYFETVGLLSNSVLQGKLLIGESNFERLFPEISGYSFFLIQTGENASAEDVTQTMENGWSDEGMDVKSSAVLLEKLLGVQNTYISAFQSLGALGLLLGTFGLVAVQLRSIVERRRELALMQAVGFSRARISHMLTLEAGLLLFSGLAAGVLSATIALAPFVLETGPRLSLMGPLGMLAVVLIVGLAASWWAVRSATRSSVLAGLRSE